MKAFLTLIFTGIAAPVAAHTGHLVDAAGHNHWLAAAAAIAVAAAAAAAYLQATKGKSKGESIDEGDEAEAENDAEPQEV